MLKAVLLLERFGVVKIDSVRDVRIPEHGPFFALSVAEGEISVFCSQSCEAVSNIAYDWRVLRLGDEGALDDTGVLVKYLEPLRALSILACSTFLRDYVLVLEKDLSAAKAAFLRAGIVWLEEIAEG